MRARIKRGVKYVGEAMSFHKEVINVITKKPPI